LSPTSARFRHGSFHHVQDVVSLLEFNFEQQRGLGFVTIDAKTQTAEPEEKH